MSITYVITIYTKLVIYEDIKSKQDFGFIVQNLSMYLFNFGFRSLCIQCFITSKLIQKTLMSLISQKCTLNCLIRFQAEYLMHLISAIQNRDIIHPRATRHEVLC